MVSAHRLLIVLRSQSVSDADGSGRFSLTLSSKTNRVVEDIVVSICLGAGTTNVSATATGDRNPVTMGQPLGAGKRQDAQAEGYAGGGTWEFDPHAKVSH